jgi:hypothetical protein
VFVWRRVVIDHIVGEREVAGIQDAVAASCLPARDLKPADRRRHTTVDLEDAICDGRDDRRIVGGAGDRDGRGDMKLAAGECVRSVGDLDRPAPKPGRAFTDSDSRSSVRIRG